MKGLLRIPALKGTSPPFVCSSCLSSTRRFASTQAATFPPPPPATGYASLTNRHLISVAGVDAPKFLNGLITASVYGREAPESLHPRRDGFYTGILTAQGRVLHDVFIYPDLHLFGVSEAQRQSLQPGQAFLVEVDAERVDALMLLIRRYKLRSALVHRKLLPDECAVWSYWDELSNSNSSSSSSSSSSSPPVPAEGGLVAPDNRAPGMGYRVVTRGGGSWRPDTAAAAAAQQCAHSAYTIRRMLRGVPEGPDEIRPDKALPMDSNMDLMGGIDFRKGCYVGQELTIRTKHRGVVRKRMLPCLLYGADEVAPPELEYRPAVEGGADAAAVPLDAEVVPVGQARARRVASWAGGVGNIGLALCRLQSMTDIILPGEPADVRFDPAQEFVFKRKVEPDAGEVLKGAELKVKAFVPEWMRQELAKSNTHKPQGV